MKEFDYKVKAEGFKGHIKIKVPNYKERMQMVTDMGIKLGNDGAVEGGDMMESASKAWDKLSVHVVSVDLSFGKHKFESLEDLSYTQEGSGVINELTRVLMGGIGLGN